MIRATAVVPAGHWTLAAADCVVLDFDERHRRRVTMTGVQGLAFLLDLPEAVMLRGGDALALDDGRLVEVVAAPEALVEVRGATPADLVRLAWHIGNRHLPAQLTGRAIRIRRDHVIEDMLRGLRASLTPIEAPFDPEGGAYASAPHADRHAAHGHDHGHHSHEHHSHEHHHHGHHDDDHAGHDHKAAPDAAHPHDHAQHDHDHDHGNHGHGNHDHEKHDHEKHDHEKHDHGNHDHGHRHG